MKEQNPPVCDYEGSDYQTSFWEEGGRAYEDKAEEIALKRLLPKSGKLLLEIGAGAGRNTPRYVGYERIVLLDYSRTQLQQAQERLGENERYIYVAADAYRLPFVDGLFGGATMIRTLHHMKDAPAVLQQVRRVLQPASKFLLEYANKLNLKAILRYLLRRQDWSPFTPEQVEFVELNFDFHPKTIRKWLKEKDFKLERQLTLSHFRIDILKRLFPTSFLAWLDSLAQLTGDWWQLSPSVFTISEAIGDTEIASEGAFFQCPQCSHAPLQEEPEMLICPNCEAKYAIRNGIYDFREPL
ncbi:MAG: methyltransferase domain-containing protein [Anaerolineae bacterium]|jgi:ubiquinone/menaquinone biosynthesis C-methylase UbiE|nr:methyltransferase domain-containing protein [Anaerolineae bacterium]MBT7189578.1 methyltransferase domain-containing protein [Anaerolineae bacterium]MBT7992067.1 methyltransferase domain-containing protein [Anaerolineae bacterium]